MTKKSLLVGTTKECITIVRDESHLTFNSSEQIFVHDGEFFWIVPFLWKHCRLMKQTGLDVDTKSGPLRREPLPEKLVSLFTLLKGYSEEAEESHQLT